MVAPNVTDMSKRWGKLAGYSALLNIPINYLILMMLATNFSWVGSGKPVPFFVYFAVLPSVFTLIVGLAAIVIGCCKRAGWTILKGAFAVIVGFFVGGYTIFAIAMFNIG